MDITLSLSPHHIRAFVLDELEVINLEVHLYKNYLSNTVKLHCFESITAHFSGMQPNTLNSFAQ